MTNRRAARKPGAPPPSSVSLFRLPSALGRQAAGAGDLVRGRGGGVQGLERLELRLHRRVRPPQPPCGEDARLGSEERGSAASLHLQAEVDSGTGDRRREGDGGEALGRYWYARLMEEEQQRTADAVRDANGKV